MVRRLKPEEVDKLMEKLTLVEARGLLNGRLTTIERFSSMLEFPSKPIRSFNSRGLVSALLRRCVIDSLTTSLIEAVEGTSFKPQSLVLCKPINLGLQFGADFENILANAKKLGLKPLPAAIAPMLQADSLEYRSLLRYDILLISEPIRFGGSDLVFRIGKYGIKSQNLSTGPLIPAEQFLLFGKK